jgi:phage tail P2-like protein
MDVFYPFWDDEDVWDDSSIWDDLPRPVSLLPEANSGAAERAIEAASAGISGFTDVIRPLWDPDTCPASLLPWLAWTLSVDTWDPTWTEAQRREVVRQSIPIHRRKGTVWAIRRALIAAGLGDATLIERAGRKFYDGTRAHDGASDHGEPDHWAEYRVTLARPLTIAQGQQARRIIEASAPLRCKLKSLDFTDVPNLENGALRHDGAFTHGET